MSDKPLAGSLKAGTWLHKAGVYARLMRLDKPIGTLLLLWPTLWALWLAAQGRPDNTVLLCFALGTLLMRSAGCVINDWADRDFDGSVARTAGRPFSRGEVAEKEALRLAAVLVLLAACCLIPLNRTVWLFALPALFVAFSYPFAKRFFPLPQLYLGISFSFGIPMAFAAVQGRVPGYAWWLFAANLCWTLAYDTIYAMADKEDDLKIGIKTSAITFGRLDAEMAMLCHGLFDLLMMQVGMAVGAGWPFWAALVLTVYWQWRHYLRIQGRDRDECFAVFLDNNKIGWLWFTALAVQYGIGS